MLSARTGKLRKYRTEQGLSMTDLARLVNMTPSGISRIEKGGGVREGNAKNISEALGRGVFDLFEIQESKACEED